MKKHPFFSENGQFSSILLKWNRVENHRDMPWKGEKDPYRIWISEIILQQTRVEQGLSYYNKFIAAFPTIDKLAKATDERVFKLWEGLGYYSRCRNLLSTARFISKELHGKFPTDYESILSLKGVGPYTAAAIASFAYDLPYAVIDGNVFRVIARITGKFTPIDSTEGKKEFSLLAQQWLNKRKPGIHNQAIMDFGATICKPALPLCDQCPFNKICFAYRDNKIADLPVKEKKMKIKERWFYYFQLINKNEKAVQLRDSKDIWQGLYEFPLIESKGPMEENELILQAQKNKWLPKGKFRVISVSPEHKQQLSHQRIKGKLFTIEVNSRPHIDNCKWVSTALSAKLAFPRFINNFFP